MLSLIKKIKEKERKKSSGGHKYFDDDKSDEENEDNDDEVLDINEVIRRIADFIKRQLPTSILIREFNGSFVYQVPLEGFVASKFFIEMEKNKNRLRITDWGISQCSLEDVFSRICEPK